MKNPHSIAKLEAFFKAVSRLTSNHDIIKNYACVTADKLGKELEKVDPEWYMGISPMTKEEKKNYIDVDNF